MPTLGLSSTDPKFGTLPFPNQGTFGIGRHAENDICLKDDDVASRFHCVIERNAEGHYILKDLGSRNGTRLNGERISESILSTGDIISIGAHAFSVVEVKQAADAKVTAGSAAIAAAAAAQAKQAKHAPQSAAAVIAATRRTTMDSDAAAPWAAELRIIIDALPPKMSGLEEVYLIDAGGTRSEALAADSPGSTSIRLLLLLASKSRATDIHCEPKGDIFSIRIRVDGQMVATTDLPRGVGDLALGLVKNACQMPQAARDAMLDGHFSVKFPDRRVDYRASITPTVQGQKLVLRCLDARTAPQNLHDLNMPLYMLDRLRRSLEQDAGMVLAAGPTGSGKTTTLYNALREIDRKRRNVITIEDPVEYSIEGVTQIPVSAHSTFLDLLRSILRQDPDVILVGEIRDEETARTAMQAAMTGHLVFSSVHAKDTIGTVFRLLDLGVESYLVANSLDVVIAQRLIRLLCEYCKRPVRVTPGQMTRMGRFLEGKTEVFAATGCARCLRTGYHGRRAIFELLDFQNDELRDCILHEPSIQKFKKIIEQGVFTNLQHAGWLLAARGMTSLDEIERVAGS